VSSDHEIKRTVSFACHPFTYLQENHLLVGTSAKNGREKEFIGSKTCARSMNHAGFSRIRRLRQKLQGRAERSLAAFTFHDILEFLAEHLLVLDRNHAAGFSVHGAHGRQETSGRKKGNRENHCS
jgi:ABC-type lipoprotein release transport system permease subunit